MMIMKGGGGQLREVDVGFSWKKSKWGAAKIDNDRLVGA